MAYDEYLVNRVSTIFRRLGVPTETTPMMGGLCFLVDQKMCVNVSKDKKKDCDRLIARIGEQAVTSALKHTCCQAFSPTGRTMKDFIAVTGEGIEHDDLLCHWVEQAIAFNPEAKRSKKTR